MKEKEKKATIRFLLEQNQASISSSDGGESWQTIDNFII